MKAVPLSSALLALSILPMLLAANSTPAQDAAAESEIPLPLPSPPTYSLPAAPPRAAHTRRLSHFYASAYKSPLTPRDTAMREAIQALGVDKHRFVRCRLKDGSQAVGGIVDIEQGHFMLTDGILGSRAIRYAELAEAPGRDPAVGEHLENGVKWTGLVGLCVALSPLVIVFYPLVAAGVIQD